MRDPEINWTRSEDSKKYAKYTLAVNRRFKKQGQPDADFIPCIAWGAMAEFAEKFMKKGGMFSVVGHLNVSSWDDNEGKKRWNTTVVVEEHYFAESKGCTPKKDGDAAGGFAEQSAEQSAEGRSGAGKQNGSAPDGFYPIDESIEDDDLPF